jgi:6-pyruvoyltetrahydropterin/6-carboxytetrahydropterin synthase
MSKYQITKVLNPGKGYPCVYRNWRARSWCRHFHGYDLVFAVTFECNDEQLTPEKWVVDFGAFAPLKLELETHFDHKFIVSQDDPEMEWCREAADRGVIDLITFPRVGVEAFANWLAFQATNMLIEIGRRDHVTVVKTEVFENQSNSGVFIP